MVIGERWALVADDDSEVPTLGVRGAVPGELLGDPDEDGGHFEVPVRAPHRVVGCRYDGGDPLLDDARCQLLALRG